MEFSCKNFSLNHLQSSMKIGTDAILLSSVVAKYFESKTNPTNILDIGTGCGIIAMCMADVFEKAEVVAIDIDQESIAEATNNFLNSPFSQRMIAQCIAIQQFADKTEKKFDLIVSNPPFFTASLHSPNIRRTTARHNNSLSLDDFVIATSKLVADRGYIAVILPEKEMEELILLFDSHEIYPILKLSVFAKPTTRINRIICVFSKLITTKNETSLQTLYIRTTTNEYSRFYRDLTSRFLL